MGKEIETLEENEGFLNTRTIAFLVA